MINQNIKFEIHAQSSRKLLVGYLTGGGEYLHEAPPQHPSKYNIFSVNRGICINMYVSALKFSNLSFFYLISKISLKIKY